MKLIRNFSFLLFAFSLATQVALAADAPKVTVGTGDDAKTYELAKFDDAKAYVDAYADNVQADKEFKQHEAAALATVRQSEPLTKRS